MELRESEQVSIIKYDNLSRDNLKRNILFEYRHTYIKDKLDELQNSNDFHNKETIVAEIIVFGHDLGAKDGII
jgi:hypothetical protein